MSIAEKTVTIYGDWARINIAGGFKSIGNCFPMCSASCRSNSDLLHSFHGWVDVSGCGFNLILPNPFSITWTARMRFHDETTSPFCGLFSIHLNLSILPQYKEVIEFNSLLCQAPWLLLRLLCNNRLSHTYTIRKVMNANKGLVELELMFCFLRGALFRK